MISRAWQWIDTGPASGAENMALDEALMEQSEETGNPVLRFYSWTEPAATFGYFQRHAEIASLTPLRPLLRRPTGGGLVPHDRDWTYSLAFPPADPWYELRAEESYRILHEWLRDSFAHLGVETALSPCCAKGKPGQCFAGPEKFDLLWEGHKVAGAAQRRSRQALLIQGSVQQQPPNVKRSDWQESFLRTGERLFGTRGIPYTLTPRIQQAARGLVETKYSQSSYLEKR